MYPGFQIYGHACPMWVPLVENKEASGDGADYFVKKDIDNLMKECNDIDTVILGCTHYPLLEDKIRKYMPGNVNIVTQGEIIANSLKDYLIRHPEIDDRCSKNKKCIYLTTESEEKFKEMASVFLNEDINPTQIDFGNC